MFLDVSGTRMGVVREPGSVCESVGPGRVYSDGYGTRDG